MAKSVVRFQHPNRIRWLSKKSAKLSDCGNRARPGKMQRLKTLLVLTGRSEEEEEEEDPEEELEEERRLSFTTVYAVGLRRKL